VSSTALHHRQRDDRRSVGFPLATVRPPTPRRSANSMMVIRSAWRSALASCPVHWPITITAGASLWPRSMEAVGPGASSVHHGRRFGSFPSWRPWSTLPANRRPTSASWTVPSTTNSAKQATDPFWQAAHEESRLMNRPDLATAPGPAARLVLAALAVRPSRRRPPVVRQHHRGQHPERTPPSATKKGTRDASRA
jgi:hypothetical protein